MSSEQSTQDAYERKKESAYINRRALMDYGMGVIYLALGTFFSFPGLFGYEIGFPPPFSYLFGGLCVVYGLFRVYRGYKKNYLN